jgi:predicted TIM-barrel fold metal-dependent hydrolase
MLRLRTRGGRVAKLRAIDLAINVDMSRLGQPEWLKAAERETFKQGEALFRDLTPDEVVPQLDAHGVARAVLGIDPLAPNPHVIAFLEKHPGRFFLAASLDPNNAMRGVRALEALKRAYPRELVEARVVPFQHDLAPDTPLYYPIYAKCIELGLVCGIYTGLPVPPVPGECQHPMRLDRVCFHFPELKLVMCHGADPWWDVAIRLMIKYRGLHLQTSAWAPKRLPPELIHFMNTRGQDKILWASNHPSVPLARHFAESPALPLREGVLDKYLYKNAARLFFGESD